MDDVCKFGTGMIYEHCRTAHYGQCTPEAADEDIVGDIGAQHGAGQLHHTFSAYIFLALQQPVAAAGTKRWEECP